VVFGYTFNLSFQMFYLTTPIPYINGKPHLGHLFEALFNDCIARYRRRSLTETVFLSMGLDQHGIKNYETALEGFAGNNQISLEELKQQKNQAQILEIVQDYTQKNSQNFKDLWEKFEISYDTFVETTSSKHKTVCEIVWQKLEAKNLIYKKAYKGLYCKGCEDFKTESQLDSNQKCLIHPNLKPVEISEENYFFRLSSFEKEIKEFLQNLTLYPETQRKEWQNFVKSGLNDVSISREKSKLIWGVEVPGDQNQVMYIWFEAVLNYLTAVVDEESTDKYVELPLQKEEFVEEIWSQIELQTALSSDLESNIKPSLGSKLELKSQIDFMLISKEIAKFHLIIFPAILASLDLPLPKTALAHGLINDKLGRKFSKSLGNGVYPEELIQKFGVEGARFVILFNVNNTEDTPFSWQNCVESYNSNLANNLGNLISRVTNLVEKHLGGVVDLDNLDFVEKQDEQSEIKFPDFSLKPVYQELENYNPQRALQNLFGQTDLLNKLLEETKPWTLAKNWNENETKIRQILTFCTKSLLETGKALSLFMPQTGQKIYEILESPKISKAEILFPKVEQDEV